MKVVCLNNAFKGKSVLCLCAAAGPESFEPHTLEMADCVLPSTQKQRVFLPDQGSANRCEMSVSKCCYDCKALFTFFKKANKKPP